MKEGAPQTLGRPLLHVPLCRRIPYSPCQAGLLAYVCRK